MVLLQVPMAAAAGSMIAIAWRSQLTEQDMSSGQYFWQATRTWIPRKDFNKDNILAI